MFQERKPNPEVLVKAERRRFSAEYKRRIIGEAEKCGFGQLGSLLRREGLTYTQLIDNSSKSRTILAFCRLAGCVNFNCVVY